MSDKKIYSYFPGCTLKNKAIELDAYARFSAEALGFELKEIEEWQCCGGVYPMSQKEVAPKLPSVRALADARDNKQDLVTLCAACYNVLKQTNDAILNDGFTAFKANTYLKQDGIEYNGETKVLHFLEILRDVIGWDNVKAAVKNPLKGKKIGFAVCGSFCTFSKVMPQLEALVNLGAEVYPIMSEMAYSTDTRFGKAKDFIEYMEKLTNRQIINTVQMAEPIGPKGYLDAVVIAPCTGNTAAKIANGVTDSCVSMAAKANLRNRKPLVIAISTNDALGANAKNIGILLNCQNVFFVPFGQDDCMKKPDSLVSDMTKIIPTLENALDGMQIQPIIFGS